MTVLVQGVLRMLKARRIFLVSLLLLLVTIASPLAAQDTLGPGEGAPIIFPNFGGDPTNLNPLLISDGPSQDIADLIFPAFLRINPETGNIDPNTPLAIASDWTISEDGRT